MTAEDWPETCQVIQKMEKSVPWVSIKVLSKTGKGSLGHLSEQFLVCSLAMGTRTPISIVTAFRQFPATLRVLAVRFERKNVVASFPIHP
jgi:hypothetical protein